MHNPMESLRQLIADGRLSAEALYALTGIDPGRLRPFLDDAASTGIRLSSRPQPLSVDEIARVSILEAQLTEGMQIDDDERLKGIFESLTSECRLTPRNIAHLSGLEVGDIEAVVRDPRTLSATKKYALAVTGSYLINAANQARGR